MLDVCRKIPELKDYPLVGQWVYHPSATGLRISLSHEVCTRAHAILWGMVLPSGNLGSGRDFAPLRPSAFIAETAGEMLTIRVISTKPKTLANLTLDQIRSYPS